MGLAAPAEQRRGAGTPYLPSPVAAKHPCEVVPDRFLELSVGALCRFTVRPPTTEPGGVPEPAALRVVVGHLTDPLRSQRNPGQALLPRPTVEPDEFDLGTTPHRYAELGDVHADMEEHRYGLEAVLELAEKLRRDHQLDDLPYPPEHPKAKGEPKRVQPSKAQKAG